MEPYTTPGQDLFEALQTEAHAAQPEHATLASAAIFDATLTRPWTWGVLPAHVKAIFSLAAARFLAE